MAISRNLIVSLAVVFLTLNPGFSESSWISECLKHPPAMDPAPLEQMVTFIGNNIPPLEIPESTQKWDAEADQLRERILEEVVYRGVPDSWRSGNREIVWGDVIETGKGYRIKKLSYECLPGLHISALLYEPENITGKVPAILNVNGHVGDPGKAIEYEQVRCINLAKRGMLALHPEWLSFGDLLTLELRHNRSGYLDMCGVSGLATFYLAMKGGLDVLLEHDNADPERVAMTGLSGGGWQTIVLSSLDKRIKICTPNAGYSSLTDRLKNRGDIGDLEQNPVDLLTIADYPHLTAMLAPRPALLIYNAEDNCCFKADRAIPSVYDPIVPFYELYGKADDFTYHINEDPGTHNYDEDNRVQFYRFLYQYFLTDEEPILDELHTADEILSVTELSVPLPQDNATYVTLAKQHFDRLPLNQFTGVSPDTMDEAHQKARSELKDTLRLPEVAGELDLVLKELHGDVEHSVFRLNLGDKWKLPVHQFGKKDSTKTVILIADEGIASASQVIWNEINEGKEVWAVDLLLLGDNKPGDTPTWQFAQMFSTTGTPGLGIQVSQLISLINLIESPVSLMAIGQSSSVIAHLAAAISPHQIESVESKNGLDSLKGLVTGVTKYSENPTLFCFGLLETIDIPQLKELHSEAKKP